MPQAPPCDCRFVAEVSIGIVTESSCKHCLVFRELQSRSDQKQPPSSMAVMQLCMTCKVQNPIWLQTRVTFETETLPSAMVVVM